MPVFLIQLAVTVIDLFARYGPGLVEAGSNLARAIESSADLTDDEKAALIARVQAARAAVAAYEPLPPKPTV